MDYGFAPGETPQDGRARNMFARRSNTQLIMRGRRRSTVKEFIEHLNKTASITKPIGDMLIGTHANSQGQLEIVIFPGQRGATQYETIEDTLTSAARSIKVPDALIGHNPGDAITHHFHIKGCNIGKVPAFLTKLKEALGGNVIVTAPLHFDCLGDASAQGTFEFMQYEFRMVRKQAFASRADYINALDAKGFTFYNGDPIAKTDWEVWVPQVITKTNNYSVVLPLGKTIGRRTTIPFTNELRYRKDEYKYTIRFQKASDIPTDEADQMTQLEDSLNNFKYRNTDTVGGFDSSHPYPEYERWGYDSLQDFIDEHEWRFTPSGKRLLARGEFHDYSMLVTVFDRSPTNKGNLIFNFYPAAGSGLTEINTGLQVTNTQLYATA